MRLFVDPSDDAITSVSHAKRIDTVARLDSPERVVTFLGGPCDGSTVVYPPRVEIEATRDIEGVVYRLVTLTQTRGICKRVALAFVSNSSRISNQDAAAELDRLAVVWQFDEPDFLTDHKRWFLFQLAKIAHWPGIPVARLREVRESLELLA